MRSAWLVALVVGCTAGTPRQPQPIAQNATGAVVPRLLPPPPLVDLDAPDAPYRATVALQLQPAWFQFLEDCRLRLPATHPLNEMSLEATVDLTVDVYGTVVTIELSGSGNADFDRAVKQVIRDAAPLPRPPVDMLSDDFNLHLRWLFARDRRQAGPATAKTLEVLLPVREVVAKLIKVGGPYLERAAKRIKREPAGVDRDAATTDLMTAVLVEALDTNDSTARRYALDAIARANLGMLGDEIYRLVTTTGDDEVRIAAVKASAAIKNRSVVSDLAKQLPRDIRTDRRLALAEAEALIELEASDTVARIVAHDLDATTPNPIALYVLGLLEGGPDLTKDIASQATEWRRSTDRSVRAASCAAHTRAVPARAIAAIGAGLNDRDATVRATCLDAVTARMLHANDGVMPDGYVGFTTIERVIELVKDRDVAVRAAAVTALAAVQAASAQDGPTPQHRSKKGARKVHVFEPSAFTDHSGDRAAEVRIAYLRAIAHLSMLRPIAGGRDRIRPLLDDRDAEVRAAAWDAFVVLLRRPIDKIEADPPPDDFDRILSRAMKDPAPEVRRAVIDAITDDVVLLRMSSGDDDGEVRTRALVRSVGRSGRAQSADLLLGRIAAATPGSAERVRVALAWHLAR